MFFTMRHYACGRNIVDEPINNKNPRQQSNRAVSALSSEEQAKRPTAPFSSKLLGHQKPGTPSEHVPWLLQISAAPALKSALCLPQPACPNS